MNLKRLLEVKNKLSGLFKDKEILDIILFGSFIKGKTDYNDIDIAVITNKKEVDIAVKGFHISLIKPIDFFRKSPPIVNTIIREGYSLKNNKYLVENWNFVNRVMFVYKLIGRNASEKVKIVNVLRGKDKNQGLVKESKGEWIANQVFIVPLEYSSTIEKFLINFKVNFKKQYILMH